MKKEPLDKTEYYGDVNDLMRKVLQTAQVKDMKFADRLRGEDRISFLKYCSETADSRWFAEVTAALMWECLRKAGIEADNWETVMVNRASINGVSMVEDYFRKYARQYHEEFEGDKPKPKQPHKAFESVSEADFYKS